MKQCGRWYWSIDRTIGSMVSVELIKGLDWRHPSNRLDDGVGWINRTIGVIVPVESIRRWVDGARQIDRTMLSIELVGSIPLKQKDSFKKKKQVHSFTLKSIKQCGWWYWSNWSDHGIDVPVKSIGWKLIVLIELIERFNRWFPSYRSNDELMVLLELIEWLDRWFRLYR